MSKIIIPSSFRNDAILQEREGGQIPTTLEQKQSSVVVPVAKKSKKSKIIDFMPATIIGSVVIYLLVAIAMSGYFKESVQSNIVANSSNRERLVNFAKNSTVFKLGVGIISQIKTCAINKVEISRINLIEIWHYKNIGASKNAQYLERKCVNELILKSAQNDSAENASAFRHTVVALGYKTDIDGFPNPLIMSDEMKDLWTH